MRSIILLFAALLLAACTGAENTATPPTPTVVSLTLTSPSATTIPDTPTSTPTEVLSTDTPPSASTFPDPNAYQWQRIVSDLRRPVDLQADGSGRLFVLEKPGRIRIIENGQLLEQPFLNITDRVGNNGNEQGLLGLAFHPRYAENGWFYLNYTDTNGDTVIARFQVSNEPNSADPGSELKLLGVDQPYPNHNGGVLNQNCW